MPHHIALNDTALTERLRLGDETALTAIYKKYWHLLYSSAYNVLKDNHACQDIIQELFIKLWNNRCSLQITFSLKAYLYACMRHAVYRQIRTGNVRTDMLTNMLEHLHTPQDHSNLEYKELSNQVNYIVDTLPDKCREVYRLSREECLSHKEIALQLNISTKTVENHITKALRQLRTSIGGALLLQLIWLFLSR